MIRRFLLFTRALWTILAIFIAGLILALVLGALITRPSTSRSGVVIPADRGGAVLVQSDQRQSGTPNAGLAQPAEHRLKVEATGAKPVPGGELFGVPLNDPAQEGRSTKADGAGSTPARTPVPSVDSRAVAAGLQSRVSPAAVPRGDRGSPAPDASACLSPCFVEIGGDSGHVSQIGAVVRTGLASNYGPAYSEAWVALPDGPGWRFRVCGPAACRTLASTDKGPNQRIFPDRIVDLPVGEFLRVCGVPWTMGLCPVSVVLLGRP